MTHDERVYHHMYETNEGIAEHAERIASLEELVRDMFDGMCDHERCGTCPNWLDWQEGYNGCEYHKRMRELGVET